MTKPTIVGRQQRKIKPPITIDNDLDSPCLFFGNLDSCRLLTYFGRVSLECLTPYRGIDYFPISTTRKSISKILITCLWIKSRSMGCGGEDDQVLPLLLRSSKFLSIPIPYSLLMLFPMPNMMLFNSMRKSPVPTPIFWVRPRSCELSPVNYSSRPVGFTWIITGSINRKYCIALCQEVLTSIHPSASLNIL